MKWCLFRLRCVHRVLAFLVLAVLSMLVTPAQAADTATPEYLISWGPGATYGTPPHSWSVGGSTATYATPDEACADPALVNGYLNAYWSFTPIWNIHSSGAGSSFSCVANFNDLYGTVYPNVNFAATGAVYVYVAPSVPPPLPPESDSCQVGSYVGNPIIPATGEKVLTQSDYEGTGAHPLNFVRSFRSSWSKGGARGLIVDPGLSQTWSHNHAVSIKQEGAVGSAGSTAKVQFGDGSARAFSWNVATGSWFASNSADTLTQGAAGLLYKRLDDDSAWQFDAAGKLLTVTQRKGWVTSYSYSDASTSNGIAPRTGLLIRVANQFGRMLSLTYSPAGQLSSVTTPDGQTVRCTFDSALRLIGAGYPGNASKSYLYEDAAWPSSITGITYIRLVRGFAYQVAIVDWYSRKVLSWRISNSMEAVFCVDCLEDALRIHGTPEMFNSDQGSQFTSDVFTGVLKREGVTISMDGRGRAFDNIFV